MARRVRWCSMSTATWCFLIVHFFTMMRIQLAAADCFYDDERYEEGVEVATFEHCLNCTCTRGVLLCYLRICPKLPNPPPPGCILLHRYRTCCPELICTEFGEKGNELEARSDPDSLDLSFEDVDNENYNNNTCVVNGTVYSPGSAMASSSLCEYCYCLRGKQTCVKPKCLLPIEGCSPSYDPNYCCPVQYNCSSLTKPIRTTTTMPTKLSTNLGGCSIENQFYPEGGKVLGMGHSVCDNCYCIRGMLRCEPLSCAPPLLGCTPIIKPGECCAASYNCTGSIEIEPEPNYGKYPIVSKEYSKLRKEQPKRPLFSTLNSRRNSIIENESNNDPVYIIAETLKPNMRNQLTSGTTRQFIGSHFNLGTTTPFYFKSMVNEGDSANGYKHVTRSYPESKFAQTTTNNEKILEMNDTKTTMSMETTTMSFGEETTIIPTSDSEITTGTTTDIVNDEDATESSTNSETITMKSVLQSTDCIDDNPQRRHDNHNFDDFTTISSIPEDSNHLFVTDNNEESTSSSEEINDDDVSKTTVDDITEVDLQSSFNILRDVFPKVKNGSEITSLLNASKSKDNDYDFDYNESSLPPSLPNLHIIPFLAADALDTKKDKTIFAQDKSSNYSFEFPAFFSPPIETEGGFVPNDNPAILETLFDNVATPAIPEMSAGSCMLDEKKILHGQPVASDSPCTTCTCFYGNIVCQKVPCPMATKNCEKTVEDSTLCCPLYICDEPFEDSEKHDSPTKKTTSDPFKDVIKTEPAPDLESLMVDMLPHFTKKPVKKTTVYYITTLQPPTTTRDEVTTAKEVENNLNLNKVLALLLGTTTNENSERISEDKNENHLNIEDGDRNGQNTSTAILKLAGCNIYGRMYRVGRIISELSGPCLECKCTEVGVQCIPLKC